MKRQVFFLLFSLILFSSSKTFCSNIDSLKHLLSTEINDTDRISACLKLGQKLIKSNPIEAEKYAQSAYTLARDKRDTLNLTRCGQLLGHIKWLQSDIDDAIKFYDIGINNAQLLNNDRLLNKLLGNKAIVYSSQGMLDEAIHTFKQVYSNWEVLKDTMRMAEVANNMGVAYRSKGDYEKALDYMLFSLKYDESQNDSLEICISTINIAKLLRKMGDVEDAIQKLLPLINIAKRKNDLYTESNIYHTLGLCYSDLGKFPKAKYHLNQAIAFKNQLGGQQKDVSATHSQLATIYLSQDSVDMAFIHGKKAWDIAKSIDNKVYMSEAAVVLGSCYSRMNQLDKGQNILEKGVEIAEEMGSKPKLVSLYKHLGESYFLTGDYRNAYIAHSKSYSLADSVLNAEKYEAVKELELKYETEKKERKIAESQLEISKQKSSVRIRNLIILFIFGLMIISWYLYQKIKEKNLLLTNQNRFLQSKNEELIDANSLYIQAIQEANISTADKGILDHEIVLTNREKSTIKLKDILYLQAQNAAVQIITVNANYWEWQRLKSFLDLLPKEYFTQSHRSYIVNKEHIKSIDDQIITMTNGDEVKISRNNKSKFQ